MQRESGFLMDVKGVKICGDGTPATSHSPERVVMDTQLATPITPHADAARLAAARDHPPTPAVSGSARLITSAPTARPAVPFAARPLSNHHVHQGQSAADSGPKNVDVKAAKNELARFEDAEIPLTVRSAVDEFKKHFHTDEAPIIYTYPGDPGRVWDASLELNDDEIMTNGLVLADSHFNIAAVPARVLLMRGTPPHDESGQAHIPQVQFGRIQGAANIQYYSLAHNNTAVRAQLAEDRAARRAAAVLLKGADFMTRVSAEEASWPTTGLETESTIHFLDGRPDNEWYRDHPTWAEELCLQTREVALKPLKGAIALVRALAARRLQTESEHPDRLVLDVCFPPTGKLLESRLNTDVVMMIAELDENNHETGKYVPALLPRYVCNTVARYAAYKMLAPSTPESEQLRLAQLMEAIADGKISPELSDDVIRFMNELGPVIWLTHAGHASTGARNVLHPITGHFVGDMQALINTADITALLTAPFSRMVSASGPFAQGHVMKFADPVTGEEHAITSGRDAVRNEMKTAGAITDTIGGPAQLLRNIVANMTAGNRGVPQIARSAPKPDEQGPREHADLRIRGEFAATSENPEMNHPSIRVERTSIDSTHTLPRNWDAALGVIVDQIAEDASLAGVDPFDYIAQNFMPAGTTANDLKFDANAVMTLYRRRQFDDPLLVRYQSTMREWMNGLQAWMDREDDPILWWAQQVVVAGLNALENRNPSFEDVAHGKGILGLAAAIAADNGMTPLEYAQFLHGFEHREAVLSFLLTDEDLAYWILGQIGFDPNGDGDEQQNQQNRPEEAEGAAA